MEKKRLDLLLSEKGLTESRSQAQRLVMAGQVRVNGQVVIKSSVKFSPDVKVEVLQAPQFVSRGGEKLSAAIEAFGFSDISGLICADIGASTGGFTDCLLQHGVVKVYAVDVGYGILHWKLRNSSNVISMERTNARYIDAFPEPVALVTIDASFISLRILLPKVKNWFSDRGGDVIALIKPQFEAGRKDAAKGEGVIRDAAIHRKVLYQVIEFAEQEGYGVKGLILSPIKGPKGNIEFLVHLQFPSQGSIENDMLINDVLDAAKHG